MAIQSKEQRDELFGKAPIWAALRTMAVPAVVANMINLIYNMADAYFVGRTGDPYMIAAISLAFPLFMFNLPISGLFGVGGGSYIARLLGVRDYERVARVSAFCFYGALILGLLYSLGIYFFMDPLLRMMGASSFTMEYARQYLLVVVVLGNVPTVLATALSHIMRNVGYSKQASLGLSMGGVFNIVLDPLFMFVLFPAGYQVVGAAAATALSNTFSLIYFIYIFNKTKSQTGLSLNIRKTGIDSKDAGEIFKVGIPSAMTTLLMDFTNMYLNAQMAVHGDLQLAALGIEMKIERLSNAICLGIAQGVLPLVAFNYSTKDFRRMSSFLNAARLAGLVVAIVSICFYQLLASRLVHLFISDGGNSVNVATTISYAVVYLRIRSLAAPFVMLNFVSTNGFQGMGAGKLALIQTIVRQLLLYFPMMAVLDMFFMELGLMAAFPVSELLSGSFATLMLQNKIKKVSCAA